MDFEAAGTKRKMQLSKLDEWREKAYHNSKIYKERTKTWHDFLILGLNYSSMENFGANGKDHSR